MARQTRQTWVERVAQWKRSGLSGRVFAQREGVHPKTLWSWSWRLRQEEEGRRKRGAAFVEVVASSSSGGLDVVLLDGVRVTVPETFDEEHLQRVLRAVERR